MPVEVGAQLVDRAAVSLRRLVAAERVATAGPIYERAVSLWNAAIRRRPAVVVRCLSAADVQAAVRVARECGLPLSVRSAGHDWAGRAVREAGVVIDVSGMREVVVDAEEGVATAQAGVTAGDLLTAAEPFGMVAVTGTVGGVGMLGLALGGGYGRLCGRFGLAADNLLAADVVLADGSLVTTDCEQDPDLFWALRGGGGNFGVVVSARFRLHPLPAVLGGTVLFPWSAAAAVLSALDDLLHDAPDELTVQSGVLTMPSGDRVVFLGPVWCGDPEAPPRSWHRLATLATPLMTELGPTSVATLVTKADQMFPPGRHVAIRTRTVAALTPAIAAALCRGGERMASPLSAISLHHFHGAATRIPLQDTAFAARTPHVMAEFIAQWAGDDPRAAEHQEWVDSLSRDVAPMALPGGYPNLLGPDAANQIRHAYGPNTARLQAVKARIDPDAVFAAIPIPGSRQ